MKQPSIAIIHYSAPPVVGGVEAVIQAHTNILASSGHRVRVIAGLGDRSGFPEEAELRLVPEIGSQFPEVLEMSAQLEQGDVPTIFNNFVTQLNEKLKSHLVGFDWLIVHNIFTKHFNLPLTCALHKLLDDHIIGGCIAWCHDFTWTSPSSSLKVHAGYPWDLLRTKWPGVKYVVVSKQRQQTLAALFDCPEDEISVIYNGVDAQELLGLSEIGMSLIDRLGLFDCDLILVMPVRVTKAKNIELALQVIKEIKAMGYRPKLILTGPPDPHDPENIAYYHSLLNLRGELGLDAEAHFIYELQILEDKGNVIDIATVGELIRASDLVFLPSHREGFGMPVLEAGLIGIPVIATEVPSIREIAGDDAIVIGSSQTPKQVAEMIDEWAREDRVHHMRRRVRQSYTWDRIYKNNILPLLTSRED